VNGERLPFPPPPLQNKIRVLNSLWPHLRRMKRERKVQKPVTREISNSSTGAAVVALFLGAMLQWAAVLAVCPSIHELIHHDADDEHHDCAVTLFLSGQVEQACLDPIILREPVPVELPIRLMCDATVWGSFFLTCCILEHAPPPQR
jgi:hypothetical protein